MINLLKRFIIKTILEAIKKNKIKIDAIKNNIDQQRILTVIAENSATIRKLLR